MPYYTTIEPDPALARAYGFLLDTIAAYQRAGLINDAVAARELYLRLRADYERLGTRAAAKADAYIRDRLRQSQVRPDTPGPHLREKIVSRALPTTFPAAYIGIADIDVLNTAINPRTGGVYWRAQEYGLPVLPNQRPAPGYFQPGLSAPDANQFRNHPYFEQMRYAKGMPALVRTHPLRARHYLRDGSTLAADWRRAESERIMTRAVSALRAI